MTIDIIKGLVKLAFLILLIGILVVCKCIKTFAYLVSC